MNMPNDREQLSAYLAGELDAAETAAFEARLAADPGLAARLDALADALVRLQGLADVEPPQGYGERLRARLAGDAEEVAAAAEQRSAGAVVDMGAERARRRPLPWAPLGAVAAGVATLAVIVSVVGPPGARDEQVAGPVRDGAEVSLEALDAPSAAEEDQAFDADSGTMSERAEGEAGDDAGQAPAPAAAAFAPVLLDSEVALTGEDTVRERYSGLPEAEELLGLDRAEAEDRAAAARIAVQRSEPFAAGVHPQACLDIVSTATDAPVVVARVESAVHDGVQSLVYVTATSSGGAGSLDRVEAWVVEPGTCATRLFITVG